MATLLATLVDLVGERQVVPGAEVGDSAWPTRQPFRGAAMVYPRSTAELSAVVGACDEAGRAVVPFGGVTNLVQGCATAPDDIGVSLARMNRIEEIDPVALTMVAEAGVTMREAQAAAADAGLLLPVDIGARDNCMLGGNASTNAGGTKVIRYGMMRDSILGLEAVLADGTVISSMNRYLKNNSGFDLKHLFIGTEGTLGIVSRLVLRLRNAPAAHNVALLGAASYPDVVKLLGSLRRSLGSSLCGFEVMWNEFYRRAVAPEGPQKALLSVDLPFYVLVEATETSGSDDAQVFERALASQFDDGTLVDGVVAKSDTEREQLWAVRHEVEWLVGGAINFDVSVRIADAAEYVDEVSTRIARDLPGSFVAAFGHLGDNNVHLSVVPTEGADEALVHEHVYDALRTFEGAVSAEHGIGLEKREFLSLCRTPDEIDLMRKLKQTLDPNGTLNPGKVVAGSQAPEDAL